MLPTWHFQLITSSLEKELARLESAGGIVATIHNDAKSPGGFSYFDSVNSGRRAFGPKTAAALRFTGARDGKTVFARRVRAVPGRWQREQAIPTIQAQAGVILAQARQFTRQAIVEIVNTIAEIAKFAIAKRTPRRTGRLASSYRVERGK